MKNEVDAIFDGAAAFGARIERRIEVQKMQEQLGRLRTTCGSCKFWMSSSECPAERNVRGKVQGPSCNSGACSKFQIKAWDEQMEKKLIDQIAALKAQGI